MKAAIRIDDDLICELVSLDKALALAQAMEDNETLDELRTRLSR